MLKFRVLWVDDDIIKLQTTLVPNLYEQVQQLGRQLDLETYPFIAGVGDVIKRKGDFDRNPTGGPGYRAERWVGGLCSALPIVWTTLDP